MNIAKYYASISFDVSARDIQKVDKALNSIENRLKAFQKRLNSTLNLDINRFTVDQRRLNIALGNALDVASARNVFQVSRFVVDQGSLNRQLTRSLAEASRVAAATVSVRPNTTGSVARAAATGAAFGGFGLGRLGTAGLALIGGGYGLGALNRRNQEVVSAQLQSQAVVQQSGGTVEQGQASFQYLRSEANRIGFNYLDASADYNKLISGLTGSGISLQQSQKVFSGFAELARVNKLDKVTQNRLFRALSQVAGKGKLQAEELTGQIAEALPGGTALFAQAYQAQKGGNLTGQAAITKLMADMKKGLVTSDILTFAGAQASLRAQPSLAAAGQASQAEQQRYQNAVSDLAVVASNAGVEEGFARIFRTLNAGLSESNGLVESLARGFNDATKFADDLLLFPQSFIRALEGRDSIVADWLGADATKQLQEDWKAIQASLVSISSIGAPSWLPTLQTTSQDIAAQFRIIAQIASGDFTGLGDALTNFVAGRYQTYGNALASGPNLALRAIGNTFDIAVPQINFGNGLTEFTPKSLIDTYGLGNNPSSGDNTRFDLFSKESLGPRESNAFGQQPAEFDYGLPTNQFDRSFTGADAREITNTTTNEFNISLTVDAATLGGIDIEVQAQQLAQAFATNLQQVSVFFPQKE
nr:MAG TPA: tail tape measure [Caudoviricetes sp.]